MRARRLALAALALCLAAGIFLALRFLERERAPELDPLAPAAGAPAAADVALASPDSAPPRAGEARQATGAEPAEPAAATAPRAGAGREVLIRVVDPDARPIAGAHVEYAGSAPPRVHATDALGECRVRTEPGDASVPLRIAADGHLHQRGYWTWRPEWVVVLRPAAVLRVRVLDEATGRELPDAEVWWLPDCCQQCPPAAAERESDGRFRLDAVGSDFAKVRVAAPGSPTLERRFELRGSSPDGAAGFEREVHVPRGVELRGRVVDFTTGAGLEGVAVESGSTRSRTDAAGAFEAVVVAEPTGGVELRLLAPQRCSMRVALAPEDLARPEPLVLRIPASPIVQGRVLDAEGRPVADVPVQVHHDIAAAARAGAWRPPELATLPQAWRLEDGDAAITRTDAQGVFRASGLVPWARFHRLNVGPKDHAPQRIPIDALPGPHEVLELDVRLEPLAARTTGSLAGRVFLNGIPCPAVVAWSGGGGGGEGSAEGAGYSFPALPPGPVELRARVSGCAGEILADTATVEIVAGVDARHDFDLRTAVATIRGSVRFPSGAPAAGAQVGFSYASARYPGQRIDSRRTTTAAEDGAFLLELPACDLDVRVTAMLGAARTTRDGVRAGADDVRLVIAESGRLALRGIDAATRAPVDPRSLRAYVSTPEGELVDAFSGEAPAAEEGWITRLLPAGPVEIVVLGCDFGRAPARAPATVVANVETRVELELHAGVAARFQLEPAPDATWKRRAVYVIESDLAPRLELRPLGQGREPWSPEFPGECARERRLEFDASGAAQLDCLVPGAFRLVVVPGDVALAPTTIELGATAPEPIVVRWK